MQTELAPDLLDAASQRVNAILNQPDYHIHPLLDQTQDRVISGPVMEQAIAKEPKYVAFKTDMAGTPFANPAAPEIAANALAASQERGSTRATPVKGKCRWCRKYYSAHHIRDGLAFCNPQGFPDLKTFEAGEPVQPPAAPPASPAAPGTGITDEQAERLKALIRDQADARAACSSAKITYEERARQVHYSDKETEDYIDSLRAQGAR